MKDEICDLQTNKKALHRLLEYLRFWSPVEDDIMGGLLHLSM